MKKIGEGQAVGCSVACLGSLTIWLMKFSKPQTNHSKNLIKCVNKLFITFIKIKSFKCLQFYNHFFISSFSHNSFLSFTFLLLFLHFHNVLLCTLYTWVGKFEISNALNKASIIISLSGNKAATLAVILKITVFYDTVPWFSK